MIILFEVSLKQLGVHFLFDLTSIIRGKLALTLMPISLIIKQLEKSIKLCY